MSKVHYSPYCDEDESYSDRAHCGVKVGESYQFDNLWSGVTCKLCIKNRVKIESAVRFAEDDAVNQMGEMAAFMGGDK